jgi:hypothetical protein
MKRPFATMNALHAAHEVAYNGLRLTFPARAGSGMARTGGGWADGGAVGAEGKEGKEGVEETGGTGEAGRKEGALQVEGAGRKNESTEPTETASAGRGRRVAQSIAERIRAVACRCWADDTSLRPSFTDIICELDIDTM